MWAVFEREENLKRKRKNAAYLHLLFTSSVFKRDQFLTLYHTILTFNNPEKKSLWKHYEKKNAGHQHFFLFSMMFFNLPKTIFNFKSHINFAHLQFFNPVKSQKVL